MVDRAVAKLCGSEAKRITKLVRDKHIRGTLMGNMMLCVKEDWIAWLATPEMIATNKNEVYVGLMKEFERKGGPPLRAETCRGEVSQKCDTSPAGRKIMLDKKRTKIV